MGPASVLALQVHPISKGFEVPPTHTCILFSNSPFSGGCSPAQLMAADLDQLASTDRPGGRDLSQNRPFRKRRVEGGQGSSVRKAVIYI